MNVYISYFLFNYSDSYHVFDAYNNSFQHQAESGKSKYFLMQFNKCNFENITFLGTLFLGNINFEQCKNFNNNHNIYIYIYLNTTYQLNIIFVILKVLLKM